MRRVIIEYVRYYDMEGKEKTIGGIQTYIMNLAKLCSKHNYEVIILQPANRDFEIKENGYTVVGIKCNTEKFSRISKVLIKKAEFLYNANTDILIFGSSVLCRKTNFKKIISIQHGIYWDIPWIKSFRKLPDICTIILRGIQALKELKSSSNANKIVCVDYNYINWYRCQTLRRDIELISIPNFVDTSRKYISKNKEGNISIIFARRFEEIRGSRLIGEVFTRILDNNDNVNITIAGSGKDEKLLKQVFKEYEDRVNFTKYLPDESIELHSNYDIAVVPSIGSEGTSLSLLEAMWAGCAVVCTNVGGMTDIVLDQYNGIMVQPNVKELIDKIQELINDEQKRKYLIQNARNTVDSSFSQKIWEKRWINVINSFE